MRKFGVALGTILLLAGIVAPSSAARPRCSPSEVLDLVHDFIDAYNRGDVSYLDQIWAQEPDFFWYFDAADPTRRAGLSEQRATLPMHFLRRSLLGDQLHVERLSVSWERGWHGAWDLTFELRRSSDDAAAEGRHHGKGAATCQRLHAWAMGPD